MSLVTKRDHKLAAPVKQVLSNIPVKGYLRRYDDNKATVC